MHQRHKRKMKGRIGQLQKPVAVRIYWMYNLFITRSLTHLFKKAMLPECLMNVYQINFSWEIQMRNRSHCGQKKRYKDTLKASFKDFMLHEQVKWRGPIRKCAGEYEARESAKQSRNVLSGKPKLSHHQPNFLSQTSLVLPATGSVELRLGSFTILEHLIIEFNALD